MVVTSPRAAGLRIAATCLRASAVVSAVGIAALAGMFAAFGAGNQLAGERLGFVNDVLAFPTLLLMLPAVAELRRLLRPSSPALVDGLTVLGLLSVAGVLVLQGMLVAKLIPFERQVSLVMVAYLGLAIWFVATGILGSRAGLVSNGGRMGALAAFYLGYPAWAVWLARRFAELAATTADVAVARPAT
jgi:hypothetical protein